VISVAVLDPANLETPMSQMEWVVLPKQIAVIADDVGRTAMMDVGGFQGEVLFARPMTGEGARVTTENLLNALIVLGLGCEPCAARPNPTLATYALDLIGSYHNAGRTTGNYLRAAARFRELGRADISAYLERHAKEERGHEKLALRDLNTLGLPGERLVADIMPPGVGPLCDLFDRFSNSDYPIGCIGYSYFFESAAAKRSQAHLDAWQALSTTGADATRFMRAHSALGSEIDHVDDMLNFIAGLPAEDRTQIALAVYETAVAVREHSVGAAERSAELAVQIDQLVHEAGVIA